MNEVLDDLAAATQERHRAGVLTEAMLKCVAAAASDSNMSMAAAVLSPQQDPVSCAVVADCH